MSEFQKAVPSGKPKFIPHSYQVDGIQHLLQHPASGLFYPPGLGKTATVLSAFKILQAKSPIKKMLVIAPLRVCHMVWPYEVKDWADFEHLSVGVLHGPNKQKVMQEDHDIYVINPDGLKWLQATKFKFNKQWMLVCDESTCFVAGTEISVPTVKGTELIEELKVGDKVFNATGIGEVTWIRKSKQSVVKLTFDDGKKLVCTREHLLFTENGWLPAEDCLNEGVFNRSNLQSLWQELPSKGSAPEASPMYDLLKELLTEIDVDDYERRKKASLCPETFGKNEREIILEQGGSLQREYEGEIIGDWTEQEKSVLRSSRWQWDRPYEVREFVDDGTGRFIPLEFSYSDEATKTLRLSDALQTGHSRREGEDSYRGRREFASESCTSSAGQEERSIFNCSRVVSIEDYEQGSSQDVWDIEVSGHPSFYANGKLAHNCYKNGSSKRSKIVHKMAPEFGRRVILTGTPAPNGLMNLWSQIKILDGGRRLGNYITTFRNRFFYPTGYMGYEYKLQDGAEQKIYKEIEDIVLHKSQDELDLPERIYNTIKVQLPDNVMEKYEEMRKHLMTELEGELVTAVTAAVVTGKLRQLCNGGAYLESGEAAVVHDAKTDVIESLMNELDGRPLLVMYEYKHDLKRLLERFPDTPYIGGGVSTKRSDEICKQWNAGTLPLLLVHPACLHPDTEVLTEHRGWVRIIEVRSDEKVHDGVEFVNHTGCQYSGYKEVIERFGIFMTPDHKLLIDDVWVEAKDVKSDLHTKRKALFSVGATNEVSICPMSPMRKRSGDASAKCFTPQQKGEQALFSMREGSVSLYDGDSFLELLAWSALSSKRLIGQELWGTWNNCMSKVGGVQKLLRGYVFYLQGWFDNRTCRCQQRVLQGELHMGNPIETTVEQKEQSTVGVPRGEDAPSRAMPKNGTEQGETNSLLEQTQQRRRSGESRDDIEIPEQPQKSHVYDLVNCGPRNRFLIRNPDGEVFISHNSAGHGLNLQRGGCHDVCWYSIPFDLELYDQANARVHRQGVKNSVTVHHIVAEKTIDASIMRLLQKKDKVQSDLLTYLLH